MKLNIGDGEGNDSTAEKVLDLGEESSKQVDFADVQPE
jgi:hypothetical protein